MEDNTHIIYGPASPLPVPEDSLGKEIHKALLEIPGDSVAMVDAFTHRTLLYRDLFQKSVNLAVALRNCGYLGQDHVFSISSENCLEFFIPVFATFFNASVMAPLNHSYTPYELEHACAIGRPKVVFCSPEVAPKFVGLKQRPEKIIILSEHVPIELRNNSGGVQSLDEFIQEFLGRRNVNVKNFEPVMEGDISKLIAVIMCSSGTTGLPKGVALSHLALNVRQTHNRDPQYHPQETGNVLGLLPFFHGFGFLMTLGALTTGKKCVCLKKFDEDVFLKSIQDYKINSLALAPPLAIFLSKTDKIRQYDLSCVTDIVCGAAPMSKSTEEEVKKRFSRATMRQGYGLTEGTLALTVVHRGSHKPGSCGKVVSLVSGKVRDPETGKSLGPNKVGELCWKGPCIMMGYYKNEQATRETFTSDGWLKTGDLGYYDEDGYFYIVDRIKELIKYKGFQVAPAELEAILINHPKIKDVGVVGLPDELVGEKPLAFVVKKEGADITEEEVKKFVAGFVSPQKRLTGGVIFIDSIPKNPSGKILRRELRDILKKYNNNNKVIKSKL